VHWRRRASDESLKKAGRLWTLHTVAYSAPFVAAAALLVALKPVVTPFALVLLAHAWVVPELHASRGSKVLRRLSRADATAERTAHGLLADLVNHAERDLLERTGLVVERGRLGMWIVGEEGAVLVRPGARRVHCYCVKVTERQLPSGDRIAHLLLALRTDELGFVTIANLVFSGACWRLERRLQPSARQALEAARRHSVAVVARASRPVPD
jgi:hypothetical protein